MSSSGCGYFYPMSPTCFLIETMRISRILLILTLFALTACTGAESITKKRWENKDTTIKLVDMTSNKGDLKDAGSDLGFAVEDALQDSAFVVVENQDTHYQLKYKVVDFQKGSRWKRMLSFGIHEKSRATLTVKVALYNKRGMLTAWEVDAWVNSGPTGGSESALFEQAAEEILKHLKGY